MHFRHNQSVDTQDYYKGPLLAFHFTIHAAVVSFTSDEAAGLTRTDRSGKYIKVSVLTFRTYVSVLVPTFITNFSVSVITYGT